MSERDEYVPTIRIKNTDPPRICASCKREITYCFGCKRYVCHRCCRHDRWGPHRPFDHMRRE